MSERLLKIGQRIEVSGKDVRGVIAYVGMTSFAVGKWVGVILDEPKGKNNGSIKGQTYFSCDENYGMFVRPTQLVFLDEGGNQIDVGEVQTPEEKPRSRLSSEIYITHANANISAGSVRSLASLPGTGMVAAKPTASRLSLNRSTSSLGSKTQLTSPGGGGASSGQSSIPTPVSSIPTMVKAGDRYETLHKSHISPPESLQTSKRASFVETGFVETLKPQFTPGQSLTSPSPAPSGTEERIHLLQLQQEIEDLKTQNKDLVEKLETLKVRRAEDRERLREFDKLKTQYDQLVEFKSKIMDAHSQLQRDLQRAKQEAKDAIEARDQHSEEMAELSENVEMITLDKEMAEEKADTLALELETAKERIEELTLDLEILKTEMQEKGTVIGDGTGGTGASTYEFKQLEQQNVRLRETLVRLRDLSAHEKHEIQKLEKELETKKSEVAELQRTKEKLSSKIDDLEGTLGDLQEQVDAALGAEEMVEQLADKKMELEDKVKALEEEVAELEALEEVHEQLVESNHELEMDMREELDMAHAAKREAVREKEAAFETIVDRDQTILKFRELVQRLNDQCQELREKLNQESSKLVKDTISETIDFKQMFAESKAFTRAIDLQLRQIELTQANEHVKYLTAFMPEIFMARGGDHDAVLVILLVSRIVFKAGIIVSQARERFSVVPTIDRSAIVGGHEVYQFRFRSRLLHHVHNLQSIMHQFLYGLTACTADTLLKIGASLPEMQAQEKMVDEIVDLLKANQLDENSSTDNLEKCVTFFNAMYLVLLAGEDLLNETQIVRDCTASISAACDSITTDAAVIRTMIKGGDETSDSGLLLQYIVQNVEAVKQQLKLIKRRLPQDASITKCNLSPNTLQNLKKTAESLNKLMSVLFYGAKQVVQMVTADPETEVSVSHEQLWDILSNACEKVYEQDDLGPAQNIRSVLSKTSTDMSQLAQYLLDHEYEIMSNPKTEEKPVAPIILRAQAVKKQLEETKTLTATLENREAEIRQLKLAAKLKLNELSEMQIRKDLAEKKLSVLQQDHETNTARLQKMYDEVCAKLKQKEKDFEETMDHLQSDIDSLESEKSSLRDKLKSYSSKKGDLKTTTALDISASSPYIAQELSLLKRAFKDERAERLKVQASEYKKILANLEPLYVPQPKDERIEQLDKEVTKVRHEWIMSLVRGAEMPTTKTAHGSVSKSIVDHENQHKRAQSQLKTRAEQLACEIMNEYLARKPHRAARGDFAMFPSTELATALKVNIAASS
ncbi:150 kDa dynein-associated polypeptide [Culex quinquefasciatus]|uniref:Dynactin subunit 1 n=1 Tax=Culex quinquefasciatus TaxID=7176 RepID=B0W933_CULQU|nr:150 kDa dynein-associated polypeptide [Culex quinquefasciatus]|eukprot:XP_001845217.1 150 kDa dynein-associated polypeptide [Culex quinquefasciatus]